MRKQFYLDMIGRLRQLRDVSNNEMIRHYDLWNNQVVDDDEGEEHNQAFNYPAVFLEYLPIQWKRLGMHKQEAQVLFNLHVCTSTSGKTSFGSMFTEQALNHLDLIDAIHYWLTGWAKQREYFGSLTRIASTQDHYYQTKIRHVETYRMQGLDTSAMREFIEKEDETGLTLNLSFDF